MAGYISTAGRSDWNTPPRLAGLIQSALGGRIDLDPCSNERSCVDAESRIALPDDGLSEPWESYGQTVFANPPYGRGLEKWLEKCSASAAVGLDVIALLPATPDTRAWHRFVFGDAAGICFLAGRLKFVGASASAPFPSALVIWAQREEPLGRFSDVFSEFGRVVRLRA